MKKKILVMISLLAVCAVLFGCGSDIPPNETSLYDEGLKISSLMSEMASSEEYLSALTGNDEIKSLLSGAAASEPDSPKAVYEINMSDEAFLDLLGVENTENMSEALKDSLTAKGYAAIAPQINAAVGVNNLAASSLCTAGTSFVNSEFSGSTLYMYVYKDGAPVIVSFSEGENHAVSASGCFDLGNAFSAETQEEIQDYFSGFGAEVREAGE